MDAATSLEQVELGGDTSMPLRAKPHSLLGHNPSIGCRRCAQRASAVAAAAAGAADAVVAVVLAPAFVVEFAAICVQDDRSLFAFKLVVTIFRGLSNMVCRLIHEECGRDCGVSFSSRAITKVEMVVAA